MIVETEEHFFRTVSRVSVCIHCLQKYYGSSTEGDKRFCEKQDTITENLLYINLLSSYVR